MRTITVTRTYNLYTYNELTDDAKQNVKNWFLQDELRNDLFNENITETLKNDFPNSELYVEYSLSSCQGDGLNIYGYVSIEDALNVLKGYSEKEKKTLLFYSKYHNEIELSKNYSRYTYSYKFVQLGRIDEEISDFIEDLSDEFIKNINTGLIKRFYTDVLTYFETLDNVYERAGYDYLYEISEEEIEETCNANEYEFDINGYIA